MATMLYLLLLQAQNCVQNEHQQYTFLCMWSTFVSSSVLKCVLQRKKFELTNRSRSSIIYNALSHFPLFCTQTKLSFYLSIEILHIRRDDQNNLHSIPAQAVFYKGGIYYFLEFFTHCWLQYQMFEMQSVSTETYTPCIFISKLWIEYLFNSILLKQILYILKIRFLGSKTTHT